MCANAVEAARAASGWAKTTGHLRAQILYYIAENLAAREAEFATRLSDLGSSPAKAKAEVAASIDRLFTFAALADKVEGRAKPVPMRGLALSLREPVGLIGALAPEDAPLLAPITLIGAALAMGNRIVLAASQSAPLVATDLYQVLDTSDVPAGTVNILTGDHAAMAPTLAGHLELDAIWSFSGTAASSEIERASAGNLKRTWVNNGQNPEWLTAPTSQFIEAATEIKTVWVPYGE